MTRRAGTGGRGLAAALTLALAIAGCAPGVAGQPRRQEWWWMPGEQGPWARPEVQDRCVSQAMRLPEGYEGELQARFTVEADGRITRFEAPTVPPEVAREVERGVRACPWRPGTDGTGRPAATPVSIAFHRWR
jgi:hypothetical protein